MRVLIMSDMEGVSGIVNWTQVNGGEPLYEECRKLYTAEVNAAVRGAKAAGATEVVAVKKGLSRYSARNKPPAIARQMIEDGAKEALLNRKRWPKPYVPAAPTTITIELSTVDSAAQFMGRHGVEIVDPLKVVSRGKD